MGRTSGGFSLPPGNPVLLSSEGGNYSHVLATSQIWDLGLTSSLCKDLCLLGAPACSRAWASGPESLLLPTAMQPPVCPRHTRVSAVRSPVTACPLTTSR